MGRLPPLLLTAGVAPLFASLDDETLIELNSQSGLLGKQAKSEIARNYLFENGFFKYDELEMVQKAMDEMIRVSKSNKGQITSSDSTQYMNAFPDSNHKLYWDNNEPIPEYAKGKEKD